MISEIIFDFSSILKKNFFFLYKNNKLTNKLSFAYVEAELNKIGEISISDQKSNSYVRFTIEEGIRVTSINSKNSILMNEGITTNIIYHNDYYTTISTYKNKEFIVWFGKFSYSR